MSFITLIFMLVYPYADVFSYPTNPERFIVKCQIRKYLRDYKRIFRKLEESDYEYYLQELFSEHNESEISRIMERYDC